MAKFDDLRFQNDPLGPIIESERAARPSSEDVVRLRARVRRSIAARRRERLGRYGALAAAVALAVLGLTALRSAPGALELEPVSASFTRVGAGGVLIEFSDGRDVHRVVKKIVQGPGAGGAVSSEARHVVRGRAFLDDGEPVAPGTIVFYSIE